MAQFRNQGVLAALLLMESCWLFLILGALGALAGGQGAVLTWPGVVIFLTLTIMAHQWVSRLELPEVSARTLLVVLVVLILYTIMGVHHGGVLWPAQLGESEVDAVSQVRMLAALTASVLLGWRGLRLGGIEDMDEVLGWEFPAGLVILIVAALIQLITDADLRAAPVAFVFFGVSLAGLALAHLEQPQSSTSVPWTRTLVWLTGGLLIGGFAVSLLPGSILSTLASSLFDLVDLLAQVILAILFIPMQYVVQAMADVMTFIFDLFGREEKFKTLEIEGFNLQELQEAAKDGKGIPPLLIGIVKWFLIGSLVTAALGILYWAQRWRTRGELEGFGATRESVREESPAEDLGTLLAGLLPSRRAATGPYIYALPSGGGPGARVRRAYFRLLNAATRRSVPRLFWETPHEYEPRLTGLFADTPVSQLTQSFQRVRFGNLEVSSEEAESLEQAVDAALEETPRGTQGSQEQGAQE